MSVSEVTATSLSLPMQQMQPSSLQKIGHTIVSSVYTPVTYITKPLRWFTVIDHTQALVHRACNSVSLKLFQKPIVDEQETKTGAQLTRDQETEELRGKFGEKTPYVPFAQAVRGFADALVPKVVAKQMAPLVPISETWGLYWTGLFFRYINHQLDMQTGYRQKLIQSHTAQALDMGTRTNIAHVLAAKGNLLQFVDIENICLKVFEVLQNQEPGEGSAKKIAGIVLKSIGNSLAQQKEIEQFLEKAGGTLTPDERLITRLEWLKKRGILSEALPDPTKLEINTLEKQLDDALQQYLEPIVGQLLARFLPSSFPGGVFLQLIYYGEIKQPLVKVLTSLFIEYGFKLVADPHQFALAVLYGTGIEVAEYELDGFGRKRAEELLKKETEIVSMEQEKSILDVGRSMLRQVQKAPGGTVREIFEEAKLSYAPCGLERTARKRDARKHLKGRISDILHSLIKDQQASKQEDGGYFNTLFKKIEAIPVLGIASMGIRGLVKTLIFSLQYFVSDSELSYTTFLSKSLTGKKFSDYISDRVVELIYHPTWRITLTELLVSIINNLHHHRESTTKPAKADFVKVTQFLFDHFTKDSPIPVNSLTQVLQYLIGDEAFKKFEELLEPQAKKPLIETVLDLAIPTFKELTLYYAVGEHFRRQFVTFEGDAKFWELFVREWLNERVNTKFPNSDLKDLSEKGAQRLKKVEKLLSLSEAERLKKLASPLKKRQVNKAPKAPEAPARIVIVDDYRAPPAPPPVSQKRPPTPPALPRTNTTPIPTLPPKR